MIRSESINALVCALIKAQTKFLPIVKERRANVKTKSGAEYHYDYADLDLVIEKTRPALAENGLVVMQPARSDGDNVIVTTMLVHSSGEFVAEEMGWKAPPADNQGKGSAITYARRNAYLAIIGATARGEDTDALKRRPGGRSERYEPRKETPNGQAAAAVKRATIPGTPAARMAELRTRLASMHVPGAKHMEVIAEFCGHMVDSKTELTADDWTRADTGIIQAQEAGEVLGRAADLAAAAEH